MAKMHGDDGVGKKRVLPIEWQEAAFVLELKERWRQANPAIPDRVRYLQLDTGLADARYESEWESFGRMGEDGGRRDDLDRTIVIAGVIPGAREDE